MIVTRLENGTSKITRQGWKEWFRFYLSPKLMIEEGVKTPPFYLPCMREISTNNLVCWFFLFAPFVIGLQIIQHLVTTFWIDFRNIAFDLKVYNSLRKKRQ